LTLEILHPESLGRLDLSTISKTPLTQPPPQIRFSGREFVLTGNFYFGKKAECQRATSHCGGICKDTVTLATDYVVVGGKGSQFWIYGKYGSKIQKAITNIRDGATTAIVSEETWFNAISPIESRDHVPALESR